MFQAKVVQIIKTHFKFSSFLFENRAICEIMWKDIVERSRPQMTMAHVCSMLDTTGHKHTHSQRICYNYCLSSATMVAWTCLNVTLYIHCLSCLFLFCMLFGIFFLNMQKIVSF